MLIGEKNVLNQQISNGIALKSVVSFIFRVTSFHIDSAPQNPLPQESLGVLIPLMHSTPFSLDSLSGSHPLSGSGKMLSPPVSH